MYYYYSTEGSDRNNRNNELHSILDSDTERLACSMPTIRRMGSKPKTTVADLDSDGCDEEAVEPV